MNDLVDGIFNSDMNKSVNLHRQNAQTDLVKWLGNVVTAKSGYDNASRAASFATLNGLKTKLKRAAAVGNAQTKAHRGYLVHMIDDIMDTE